MENQESNVPPPPPTYTPPQVSLPAGYSIQIMDPKEMQLPPPGATALPPNYVSNENDTTDPFSEAIRLADKLRKDHNGIMGVYLALTHDGGNYCWFDDLSYETATVRANGPSLHEAIRRCMSEWRYSKLSCGELWAMTTVEDYAQKASERFDGVNREPDKLARGEYIPGVFNTACFQSVINAKQVEEGRLTDDQVFNLLNNHQRIIRLYGGSHWMLLPGGANRYMGEGDAAKGSRQ